MVGNYSKPSNWMGFLGLERSKTTQIVLHMLVTRGCNAPRNLKVQIVQDISSLGPWNITCPIGIYLLKHHKEWMNYELRVEMI